MPIESVRCLTRLVMRCLQVPPSPTGEPPRDFTISQHFVASSMLPYARASVIDSAAKAGATHALLLDSDMTFPEDTAHRLMVATARCGGFVAANCPTRRPPIRWTARKLDGSTHDSRAAVEAARVPGGIESVASWTGVRSVGVAVAMLTLELWAKLERPAFNFAATPRGWVGEDIWFCERLTQAGAAPVVDDRLSLEVGHVGSHVFTPAEIGGTE